MRVDEESLATLLPTPQLRAELALLIALCTDGMRRAVAANFVPPDKPNTSANTPSSSPPENNLIDFDGLVIDEVSDTELARRRRYEDLSSPQMQAMRRAAFSFFDAWRVGLLRRVGEVLSVRAQAVQQRRSDYNARADREVEERRQQYKRVQDQWKESKDTTCSQIGHFADNAIPTSLINLDEKRRSKILLCLVLLVLSLEKYPAHSSILLRHVAASLHLPGSALHEYESTVAHGLLSAASSMSGDESMKKEAAANEVGRRWKVGLATVAGAALLGVTGGLAAPLLAAGVGAVMGGLGLSIPLIGGYLGAMIGSSVLIGGLFGSFGGRMTGKMMEKYAKEVQDFKFIPIGMASFQSCSTSAQNRNSDYLSHETDSAPVLSEEEKAHHKLRVAIGIGGWLINESDITIPWHIFSNSSIEPFALQWEVSSLLDLGISISAVLKSYAWSVAKLELVRHTVFSALLAGLWPLGLLKVARVLDNPYSVAKARGDKAGRVLAEALTQKVQGERPVTLVGYSLGARVIYQALLTLAEQNVFGLVESVVLIGAPTPVDERDWTKIRAAVAGRVVNVYSDDDYILGFLYRASSLQFKVAGLQPVENVVGVENFDASVLLNGKGHTMYQSIVGQILQKIEFEDVSFDEVTKEIEALKAMEGKMPQVEQIVDSKQINVRDNESQQGIQESAEQVQQEVNARKAVAKLTDTYNPKDIREPQGITMVDTDEESVFQDPMNTNRQTKLETSSTRRLQPKSHTPPEEDDAGADAESSGSSSPIELRSIAPEPIIE